MKRSNYMKGATTIRSITYFFLSLLCDAEKRQILQNQMAIKNIIDKNLSKSEFEISINDIYILINFCNQFYEHGVCTMEYIHEFYYDYKKDCSNFKINAIFIHLLGIFTLLVLNEEISNAAFSRNYKHLIIRYFGNDLLEISNKVDINLDQDVNACQYRERLDYLLSLLFDREFNKRIKTYISDIRTRIKTEMIFKNLGMNTDVDTAMKPVSSYALT